MSSIRNAPVLTVLLALAAPAASTRAGVPLETETARFAPRGTFEAEGSFEVQRSKDGNESALPLAFEYALMNRLELMAEPVPFTRIRPKTTAGASGAGDLEVTLSGLVLTESPNRPVHSRLRAR